MLARENLRQRNTAHRCLNRLLHGASCVVVHLLPSVMLHFQKYHTSRFERMLKVKVQAIMHVQA